MSYRQSMSPTPPRVDELDSVVAFVADEARKYLDTVGDRPVRDAQAEEAAASFGGSLPEDGIGAIAALQELIEGGGGFVHSAGPKFFHFVNGGTTPAALGADWLTSTWDQNPGAWVATPLGGHLESVALGWLKELFGLPQSWGGVLTTGATMANFTALACARRWWGLRHGVDVDVEGLGGLPRMPVFGSGYVHPSDTKALAMLGLGRDAVRKLHGRRARAARPRGPGARAQGPRRRARRRDRERRRGERRRLRPARQRWPTWRSATEHGSTWTARSVSSPPSRTVPAISSRASSAPTR